MSAATYIQTGIRQFKSSFEARIDRACLPTPGYIVRYFDTAEEAIEWRSKRILTLPVTRHSPGRIYDDGLTTRQRRVKAGSCAACGDSKERDTVLHCDTCIRLASQKLKDSRKAKA